MPDVQTITQESYATGRALVIAAVRAAAPQADTRQGTALGELLVRPFAAIAAELGERADTAVAARSLSSLTETSADADVDAVLSLYGVVRASGSLARGQVVVRVVGADTRTLPAGTRWVHGDLSFQLVGGPIVAAVSGGDVALLQGDDLGTTWYFVVTVEALVAGAEHNIPDGAALAFAGSAPTDVISASAYAPFYGGSARESVASARARIPAAMTTRGLHTRAAIQATLTDPALAGISVADLAVHGFGDPGQLRGGSSPLAGTGSACVDVYVRASSTPAHLAIVATGVRQDDGTYLIDLTDAQARDVWYVARVTSPGGTDGATFGFACTYLPVATTAHALDQENPATFARSAFSRLRIRVTDAAYGQEGTTRAFKVMAVMNRGLYAAQAYVDRPDVRLCGQDILLRGPTPVEVRVSAAVYADPAIPTSVFQLAVAATVNRLSFVRTIGSSSLLVALHAAGAVGVRTDGSGGIRLSGRVHAADGALVTLPPAPMLRLDGLENTAQLVHPAVCAYVCSVDDVAITRITA